MEYSNKSVIYARVSTLDKQEYTRQISDLKTYAKVHGLEVKEVFSEKISGGINAADRAQFSEMINYIEENDVHHVLITELSRLGRAMRDTINIIHDFNEKKICVHIQKDNLRTLDKNFDEDKITNLIISILGGFADIERQTIKQRAISGIRHNVSMQGCGQGIIKPYGYRKEGKRLIIDPGEAETVKYIFKCYIEGIGSHQIANILNDKKIPTKYNNLFDSEKVIQVKGGKYQKAGRFVWRGATVLAMLSNTIYKGERKHKGEIFEIEPIIDAATFNRVELIRRNRLNIKSTIQKYDHIFSGILKCPKCGSGYFLHRRADKKDNVYKCLSTRKPEIKCHNPGVNIDKLNNAIYAILKTSFNLENTRRQLEDFQDSFIKKQEDVKIAISQISQNLDKIKSKQVKLAESYVAGDIERSVYLKLKSKLGDQEGTRNKQLLENEEKLHELKNTQERLAQNENKDLLQRELFKKHIKDYLDVIYIHEVTSIMQIGSLSECFSVKNDTILLVEVKSEPLGIYKTFLMSRGTSFIIEVLLNHTNNLHSVLPYMDEYEKINLTNEIDITRPRH